MSRDSLAQQAVALGRAWRILLPAGALLAGAATWGASAATTWAGIPSRDELQVVSAQGRAGVLELQRQLGAPPAVESGVRPRPPVYARLDALELARLAESERLGLEVRERVGLQVALYRALQAAGTRQQREVAERAALAARLRFDDFVLRMSPREAADKVLEEARVPR